MFLILYIAKRTEIHINLLFSTFAIMCINWFNHVYCSSRFIM